MTERTHLDEQRPRGHNVGRAWARRARENEETWGVQHPQALIAAISEEVGEVAQAYIDATHEGSDPVEVQKEIDDLGPLLMQLVESVRTHPMAFEPLPSAADVPNRSDEPSETSADNRPNLPITNDRGVNDAE